MLSSLWITIATMIDFAGSLIIAAYVLYATAIALRTRAVERARLALATGVIFALDVKLGATLLKTLILVSWEQIGMFATIFAIRFLLKRTFSTERKKLSTSH